MCKGLPEHLRHFHQIPCASRSLYTGMLVGGLVGTAAILRSRTDRCRVLPVML